MRFTRRSVLKMFAMAGVVGAVGIPQIPLLERTLINYQLGKKPARHAAKLKLRDYFDPSGLPTPPQNFGHEQLIPDWQVLGNDVLGDCAIAGPMHAEMLWNAQAGRSINVNTDCTVKAYSAITGYDPSNPSSDLGSDVAEVAEYWRTTGLTDADGKVHKIDAYLTLEPGNIEELWYALYLFDGVGIGINFPSQWMYAFNRGQIWDSIPGDEVAMEGGHYILGVGRRGGFLNTITWGQTQLMTPDGYRQFNDETFVYLTEEKLVNGKSLEGFNLDQLKADLETLRGEPLACPVTDQPEVGPGAKKKPKTDGTKD